MKIKFFPPLGKVAHKITQTYHSTPIQQAVDISSTGGKPVYAVCDGEIMKVVKDGGQSWFAIKGDFSYQWILYVHASTTLKVGVKVKRGQKIGTIYSQTGSHLHITFQDPKRYHPGWKIMDYFDLDEEGVKWYATHKDIIALWCKPSGVIDPSKFKDTYIEVEDDCSKYQTEIVTLKAQNAKLQTNLNEAVEQVKDLELQLKDSNKMLAECGVNLAAARKRITELEKLVQDCDTIGGLLSALIRKIIEKLQSWLSGLKAE